MNFFGTCNNDIATKKSFKKLKKKKYLPKCQYIFYFLGNIKSIFGVISFRIVARDKWKKLVPHHLTNNFPIFNCLYNFNINKINFNPTSAADLRYV